MLQNLDYEENQKYLVRHIYMYTSASLSSLIPFDLDINFDLDNQKRVNKKMVDLL